jgi:hypothetical protein
MIPNGNTNPSTGINNGEGKSINILPFILHLFERTETEKLVRI